MIIHAHHEEFQILWYEVKDNNGAGHHFVLSGMERYEAVDLVHAQRIYDEQLGDAEEFAD